MTWTRRNPNNRDHYNIYGRLFDNEGIPIGQELQINTSLGYPSVTSNDTSYFVTWNSQQQDGDGNGIYGSLIEDVEYFTDPLNPDTDNDGLLDGEEILTHGTLPTNPDTDNDGLTDGEEILLHHTNPLENDTDNDGAPDGVELGYGSNPLRFDTDNDGIKDGWEIGHNLDPLTGDTDNDGHDDRFEVITGSDPRDASSQFKVKVNRNSNCCTEVLWSCEPGKTYKVYVGENASQIDSPYGQPIKTDHSGLYRFIDAGIDADNDNNYDGANDIMPSSDEETKTRFYRIIIPDDIF